MFIQKNNIVLQKLPFETSVNGTGVDSVLLFKDEFRVLIQRLTLLTVFRGSGVCDTIYKNENSYKEYYCFKH